MKPSLRDLKLGLAEFCVTVRARSGLVMDTTPSLSLSLGYPRDFWIGRNIADFVSVKDRHFFSVNEGKLKLKNFCCRFRVYRNLRTGFAVKEKKKKFKFSNISVHEDQMSTESYRFFRVRNESI